MLNYAIEFERKYGTLEDLEHFESKLRQKNNQLRMEEEKMAAGTGNHQGDMEIETKGFKGKKRNYEEYKQSGHHERSAVDATKRMKPNTAEREPTEMFADMK